MVSVGWPCETFIERSVRSLSAAGVDVQLAVTRRPGQTLPRATGFRILELPSWSLPVGERAATFAKLFLWKAVRHPRALARLARAIHGATVSSPRSRIHMWYRLLPFAGVRPDVVHFQWNSSAIDYEPLFDLLGCPAIVSCRGSQVQVAPHNPHRRDTLVRGLRRTFARAASVHCVAEAIATSAGVYGLTRDKAVIIHPAADPDFFNVAAVSSRLRSEPLHVVTAGSLGWVKDHETALLAVRRLAAAGVAVTFDIYGDGPDRQRLQYTIEDLGLQNVARLHGKVTDDQWRSALHRAHVFLLSSVSEGISNAALEAMSCGVPVVTTDCGGMREAVRDGIDGYVVSTRDAAAMAERLVRLGRDDDQRLRMGRSARERVLTEFSLDAQTQAWLNLYRTLMSGVHKTVTALTPTSAPGAAEL